MSARSTVWLRLPAAAHRRWWLGLLLCALALLATSTLSQPRVEAGSTDGYRLFNPSTDNTVTVQKGSTAAFVAYTFWLAPNDNTFTYIDITTPGAPAAVRHYDGFTEFVNCTPQCYTDGGIVGGTRLVYHHQFLSAGDYTLQIGYWPKEPLADLGHFYVAPAWHVHVPEDPIIANDHTPPVWNASLLMAPALSQYTASAWANNWRVRSTACCPQATG